jgi:P27 family predicted phage terminase small subunit
MGHRKSGLPNAPKSFEVAGEPGDIREARGRWVDIVREYDITDPAGRQLLMTYCEAFLRMRGCQRQIKADGVTFTDRLGNIRQHPLLSVERDARQAMLMAMRHMNLDVEPLRDRRGGE